MDAVITRLKIISQITVIVILLFEQSGAWSIVTTFFFEHGIEN